MNMQEVGSGTTEERALMRRNLKEDMYNHAVYWILREGRVHHGGWPPIDARKVACWASVRLIAHITGKSPREVALDIIERYEIHHGEDC